MLEALNQVVIGEISLPSEFPMKMKKCEQTMRGLHILGFIQGPYNWEGANICEN